MASFKIGATPAEDLIAETEATSKEPQVVAPAPEPVKTVDHVVDGEEDFEGLIAAPPYGEQIEYSDDDEEEKDAEYSPFIDDGDDAELFRPAAGEPAAAFCDFNEDDDEDEA
ncbi:hypothetical protein ACP275_04G074000 [Erythranthe tilingii]